MPQRRLDHRLGADPCVLSLPQLDREWDSVSFDKINDGIFILNLDRKSVVGNKKPLQLNFNHQYMSMSDRLYEMLWRKEERGEVIWIKGKTYEYISKRLTRLPIIPQEMTLWQRN